MTRIFAISTWGVLVSFCVGALGCEQSSNPSSRENREARSRSVSETTTEQSKAYPQKSGDSSKKNAANQPPPPSPTPDPAQDNPQLIQAGRLLQQSRFRQAKAWLRPVLEQYPGSGMAELYLGIAEQKQQHYSLARNHFKRSIELNTDFPDAHLAHYFLGWCEYRLGDTNAAKEAFRTHLSMRPNNPDTHFGLGVVALETDRIDAAKRQLQKSIDLLRNLPNNSEGLAKAYARLGDVAMRRDNLEQAEKHLELATTLNGEAYEAWHKLYVIKTRLGKKQDAAKALKQFKATSRQAAQRRAQEQ